LLSGAAEITVVRHLAAPVTSPQETAYRVNFAWLIRLRFGAVVGQIVVITAVSLGLHTRLPLIQLGSVLGLELLLNAWSVVRARSPRPIGEGLVTASVSLDLLLFSALLYFSGGPANPFSFLYLIHIALAAVVLPPRAS
jgi:two-component system sensor histidine kinase RegB